MFDANLYPCLFKNGFARLIYGFARLIYGVRMYIFTEEDCETFDYYVIKVFLHYE